MIKIENMTGKMLMYGQTRNLICTSKSGYQIPISLGVRINAMIDGGVQYCGVMNFKLKKGDSCILMVNKKGKIEEMTKNASRYFEKGKNFNDYNRGFSSIFRVRYLIKPRLFLTPFYMLGPV